jgi:chemotaxis protein CheD
MKFETYKQSERIIIEPGEYYSTGKIAVISTLLGSCVAACLFDPVNRMIGMNHFMLSNQRYARNMPIHISEAGRYGIHAMELLINDMMARGAKRSALRAKVFGGATILFNEASSTNFQCVGQVNCSFIREFLGNERIPIDAEDLGGTLGRVIHYSNMDFAVHCRKIKPERSLQLAMRDRNCWQDSIDRQQESQTAVDLW